MQGLAARLDALRDDFKPTINESIGCALALQARRGGNAEVSQSTSRELYVPHASLVKMLREFLGNESASFKTPEQAEAVEFVLAQERHLLLVGPTAMGKTLVYMLPAAQRSEGITCVLLPLSALHVDFDRRCKELRIEASRWTLSNQRPRSKIVYVSPEHAQSTEFVAYVFELHSLGHLKQFVVDEVHLVKSHSGFRFCFSALKPLLGCGKIGDVLIVGWV